MKFFLNIYDNFKNKPFHKYKLNLFFLKNNIFFNISSFSYIHIFLKFKKLFNIKIFKITYKMYVNFMLLFMAVNFLIQILVLIAIMF